MEDPADAQSLVLLETLYLPWAVLFLLYSLGTAMSYLLDMASHNLLARAAVSPLPAPLSAAWFGYQLMADAIFTGLLPLILTWTQTCWPLGLAFCRLDPSLAFLTFWASGRFLTRVAADCCASLLQPTWALGHQTARQVVLWAGGCWILLLGLARRALGAARVQADPRDPFNGTMTLEPPKLSQDPWAWSPVLDQLVFGLGVPLGVLGAFYSVVRMQLQLARVTGRPPLLGLPWATTIMLFLCWFPFHLLLLLSLLGARGPGLRLGDVGVLLRPLALTPLGSGACLSPLLCACGDQAFRGQLLRALRSPRVGRRDREEAEVAEHWECRPRDAGGV